MSNLGTLKKQNHSIYTSLAPIPLYVLPTQHYIVPLSRIPPCHQNRSQQLESCGLDLMERRGKKLSDGELHCIKLKLHHITLHIKSEKSAYSHLQVLSILITNSAERDRAHNGTIYAVQSVKHEPHLIYKSKDSRWLFFELTTSLKSTDAQVGGQTQLICKNATKSC